MYIIFTSLFIYFYINAALMILLSRSGHPFENFHWPLSCAIWNCENKFALWKRVHFEKKQKTPFSSFFNAKFGARMRWFSGCMKICVFSYNCNGSNFFTHDMWPTVTSPSWMLLLAKTKKKTTGSDRRMIWKLKILRLPFYKVAQT